MKGKNMDPGSGIRGKWKDPSVIQKLLKCCKASIQPPLSITLFKSPK